MKISTYTITSIVVRPIKLAAIIVMMSVSTLKTAVTLYVKIYLDNNNNPSKSQQKLIKTYINNLYISEDTRTDQYRKSNMWQKKYKTDTVLSTIFFFTIVLSIL